MKYKTKIVQQNGGYIGHVMMNEEIVFTTNFHKDTVMIARELSSYMATAIPQATPVPFQKAIASSGNVPIANNLVPVNRNVVNPNPPPNQVQTVAQPSAPTSRKCCGRG